MIAPGATAPVFQGLTQEGTPLDLASFRGRPVVLYFYPKANTAGCTAEARGFADHYAEFQAAGVAVIGVSVDTVVHQKSFSDKCGLPFPLVADRGRTIARAYGVLGLLGLAKRVTFLIDAEGRVVERIEGMMPGPHVRRAVESLTGKGARS